MEIPQLSYATLIALTYGLVEVVKRVDTKEKYNRFLPATSVLIGLVLGLFSGVSFVPALSIGLAAAGLYRGIKVMVLKE